MAPTLTEPVPAIKNDVVLVSFPVEHVCYVTMNRPKSYNAMNDELNDALERVVDWFENEPSLRVMVLGTTSPKAWCAGMDLKHLDKQGKVQWTRNGFGGITTRFTRKPIIGAIRGFALGGGCEMVMNLDVAVASDKATFGFPEVKRGIAILAGGLERFVKLVGHQRAAELTLTGRNITPEEALKLGMISYVVPDDQVDAKAIDIGRQIASNSPDSIMATLYGIRITGEVASAEQAHAIFSSSAPVRALNEGENLKEGVKAFAEKRTPRWVPSKL